MGGGSTDCKGRAKGRVLVGETAGNRVGRRAGNFDARKQDRVVRRERRAQNTTRKTRQKQERR